MLRLLRLFRADSGKRKLSGCEAHAARGTPKAFRAGAAKPRSFLRFGSAETQGVRTVRVVHKSGGQHEAEVCTIPTAAAFCRG